MPDKTMMAEMMKGPHHKMMEAYKQNVVNFAAALRDMAGDKQMFDRDFARTALVEIKNGAATIKPVGSKPASSVKITNAIAGEVNINCQ